MKVIDIIRSSKKTFASLEIVPPLRGIGSEELLDSISPLMEFDPKYINVTCHRDEVEFIPNPDGTYRKQTIRKRVSEVAVAAAIMKRYNVDVVPHVICAGATADGIQSEIESLRYMGIDNILALRGDCLTGEKRFTPTPGGYSYASELVEAVRRSEPGMCIGVGAYPEKHFEAPNIETDIEMLKKKVDAGADYIITQMFFDNKVYYRFVELCRAAGITVPIIPGLKPLSSAKQVELLPQAFSLDIPKQLTEAIAHAGDDKEAVYEIGTEWCAAQCADLLQHGVPAVHFYTMGKPRNISAIMKKCF